MFISYLTTQVVFSNSHNTFWIQAIAKIPAITGTVRWLRLAVICLSEQVVTEVLTQQRSQIRAGVTCVKLYRLLKARRPKQEPSTLGEVEMSTATVRACRRAQPLRSRHSLWHNLMDTHSLRKGQTHHASGH